jgi:hypothetical protein
MWLSVTRSLGVWLYRIILNLLYTKQEKHNQGNPDFMLRKT